MCWFWKDYPQLFYRGGKNVILDKIFDKILNIQLTIQQQEEILENKKWMLISDYMSISIPNLVEVGWIITDNGLWI